MKNTVIIALGLLVVVALITGCSGTTKDFFKALEGKVYDQAAESVSSYCEKLQNLEYNVKPLVDQERVQGRREIRQRGHSGPVGPDGNSGPVVMVWCAGDEPVPAEVWKYLEKNK